MSIKSEYKNALMSLIYTQFPNAKIYLFGSRATKKYSPFSDIDIAIDIGQKADTYKMSIIKDSIEDLNIPLEVDLVDFHAIPEALQKRINKEKILWKN